MYVVEEALSRAGYFHSSEAVRITLLKKIALFLADLVCENKKEEKYELNCEK